MQTVKNLLKKSEDSHMALLAYCTSPLKTGYSPAELFMGRNLRTTIPAFLVLLEPKWSFLRNFKLKEKRAKMHEKLNFDERHNVCEFTLTFAR